MESNTTVATKKSITTNITTIEETATVDTTNEIEIVENRTEALFLSGSTANNILAAWRGLYHLFGARVEEWVVTQDGVFVNGLTFDADIVADPDQILDDLCFRDGKEIKRDLPLVPSYLYVNGNEPEIFADAGSMTLWMAKFFRGAGEGDSTRSPEYVKKAIAAYKNNHNMKTRKGRMPKKIEVQALGSIDPSILATIDAQELERLKTTLENVLKSKVTA